MMCKERPLVKRIAVISHRRAEATNEAFLQIINLCRDMSVEVVVPENEAEKSSLSKESGLATVVSSLENEQVDFCVALGGDGTILRAFSRFKNLETPVLGVNFGQVGYLSAMGPEAVPELLKPVLEGNFELLDLCLLEMELGGSRHLAVNDIVVHKPERGAVIRLEYSIGDIQMDTVACDGLVVSTPAGSTAYNLSTGGPLASLGLEAFIFSSIAPHTLKTRPIVLAAGEKITITNRSFDLTSSIYLDGCHLAGLAPQKSITIGLSDRKAQLVRAPGADFYRTLRDVFIEPNPRD